jgi:hypothetical protein
MKMGFLLPNLIRVLALLLVLIAAAYSQNTGTSPQQGTTSQSPSQAQTPTQPTQNIQTPSQTPSTLPGETQTAPPQPRFSNTSPSEAARRVGWGWLVLGLGIGLLIGALAWRRTDIVTREDTRRDRVA